MMQTKEESKNKPVFESGREVMLSPSMMCADISDINGTLRVFEKQGIDYLHIDIMDGEFVPNYTLGVDFCKRLRRLTDIPLDLHLMIQKPEEKLDWFDIKPGEIVSVHWESTAHMQRVLTKIRSFGAAAMAAINPATPIRELEEITDDLDGILIMTVNPGYAGQSLIPSTLEKIKKARRFLTETKGEEALIEADGNVSFENAVKMRAAGADILVGGSSSIFFAGHSMEENILKMKAGLKRL